LQKLRPKNNKIKLKIGGCRSAILVYCKNVEDFGHSEKLWKCSEVEDIMLKCWEIGVKCCVKEVSKKV